MVIESVTRKAILIGAPGGGSNYLKGVNVDLANIRSFLSSPNGGCFYPNEIISLPKAELSDVASIIQETYVDYLFVYFSGHGYTEMFSNRRMLSLQDYHVEDLFLLSRSPRQLVIADACRNYTSAAISGFPQFGEEPDYFDGQSDVRHLFDQLILYSPFGSKIIHGTQRGQYSSDSSSGGYFTRALLEVATKIRTEENYTWSSIENTLYHVPSILRQKNNYQVPEVTYKTGGLRVPFAIGVPSSRYRTVEHGPVVQHEFNTNWAEIGLSVLLLAAIGCSLGGQAE